MDPVDSFLQATAKASFTVINDMSKDYGFVDPKFYKRFRHELTQVWVLIDFDKNQNWVMFRVSRYDQRLTIGWTELRAFYNMTALHSLYLRYLGMYQGNSIFYLTLVKREEPREIPPLTQESVTVYQQPIPPTPPANNTNTTQCDVSEQETNEVANENFQSDLVWQNVLTEYQASNSKLYIPKFIGDKLRACKVRFLVLFFERQSDIKCKLNIRSGPRRSVSIGAEWKQFCAINDVEANQMLEFRFDPADMKIVNISIP